MPPADAQPLIVSSGGPSRLAALARIAPSALLLFSETGALLAQNEAAREVFGAASLGELFGGGQERAEGVVAQVRRRGRVTGEVELATLAGRAWFLVHAYATQDPETGAVAVGIAAEDITERRSAERAKDEFIAIVNHELRTPLTAIRGAVGLLANDAVEDAEQRAELFDIAWDNVVRLGRLVDDLLDVQRLRLGAVDLLLTTLEVAPLVAETLELLGPTAQEAGVSLRMIEPAPGGGEGARPPQVRADAGRLVQAVSNLVGNAVKHAPPGSAVSVEVTERGGVVRVDVRDEGPGVPAAFVPSLFAPFTQADTTATRAHGGAGLGLYIARTLVEAHGGTVGYQPAPSGGSDFFIELPAAADASMPDSEPISMRPSRLSRP